jgi:hypothetical protein
MRDVLGFAVLVGALLFGILGWSMFADTGYLKLLGVLMLLAAFGLLLVALGALRDSRHPGLARAATWLFWILVGLMVLLSLSERFGSG